jgi:hypothetical protein
MNIQNKDGLNNKQPNNLHFLSHLAEPVDKYAQYLSEGDQPVGGMDNPRNLFDDSNSEDKKWLKITRKYLNRLKRATLN